MIRSTTHVMKLHANEPNKIKYQQNFNHDKGDKMLVK